MMCGRVDLSLPIHWTLEPWREAWFNACVGLRCTGLSGFFINSFAMAIPAVVVSTAVGAVNGYALTQWRFRGADLIFALLLFGAFIPYQIVLIPMARTLGFLNLANTIPGLILVHIVYGIPFTTLFFRNFMISLPLDLVSAARVTAPDFSKSYGASLCRLRSLASWSRSSGSSRTSGTTTFSERHSLRATACRSRSL